jgi:hypothetical protein
MNCCASGRTCSESVSCCELLSTVKPRQAGRLWNIMTDQVLLVASFVMYIMTCVLEPCSHNKYFEYNDEIKSMPYNNYNKRNAF